MSENDVRPHQRRPHPDRRLKVGNRLLARAPRLLCLTVGSSSAFFFMTRNTRGISISERLVALPFLSYWLISYLSSDTDHTTDVQIRRGRGMLRVKLDDRIGHRYGFAPGPLSQLQRVTVWMWRIDEELHRRVVCRLLELVAQLRITVPVGYSTACGVAAEQAKELQKADGGSTAAYVLVPMLNDPGLRKSEREPRSRWQTRNLVPILIEELRHEEGTVRHHAVIGLDQLASIAKDAGPELNNDLKDALPALEGGTRRFVPARSALCRPCSRKNRFPDRAAIAQKDKTKVVCQRTYA